LAGGGALCAPRAWARGVPGAAVANCSAGFVLFPEGGVLTDGNATDGNATEDGNLTEGAAEFEDGVGGEGFRCTAQYAKESEEFNDLFFTFTAPSLEACKAICVAEDYCAGVEFVAHGLACRLWWHPVSSLEPADGHSCARRASPNSTDLTPISSSEAQARAQARAAAKAAADAAAAEEAMRQQEEADAAARARNAAIGGGVAGAVAGAGLLAGLLGGLLGQTTTTLTTTLLLAGSGATVAENRTLADVPAEGAPSAGQWVPFAALLLLSCAGFLLLLVHTRSRAVSRSVALEREGESPSRRAEAGVAPGPPRQQETYLRWPEWSRRLPQHGAAGVLRWPEWSRHLPQYEGVDASDAQSSPLARWPENNEALGPRTSLMARAPPGSPSLAPLRRAAGQTEPVSRQVEPVSLPVEPLP